MPTPTIPAGNLYMNATLWAGNATLPRTITNGVAGQSFQPDFVWMKDRTVAYYHQTYDSVRGTGTGGGVLYPNATDAVDDTYKLDSFNSNGVTLGTNLSAVNANGSNIVGWMWKAGGAAVSNTAGSVTSQVSANTTSGFSVFTFNSGASGTRTVGHGLGAYPGMIIFKDIGAAGYWNVWHSALPNPAQSYMYLDLTNAAADDASQWSNTAPTSSVFTYNSGYSWNTNRNMVAYAWTPIAGYSAFGSYTGNGSTDGPFVYTGFRPRFVLTRRSNAIESWRIGDSSRSPYNGVELELFANLSNAEEDNNNPIDYLSNGFKIRTSGSGHNASGGTYIYMAFAENPFKYANAR